MQDIEYKTVKQLELMSSTEIDDYKMNLEEHLKDMLMKKEIVHQEKLELERKIHELRTRLSKAGTIISEIRITVGLAKSMYWKKKNQEKEEKYV